MNAQNGGQTRTEGHSPVLCWCGKSECTSLWHKVLEWRWYRLKREINQVERQMACESANSSERHTSSKPSASDVGRVDHRGGGASDGVGSGYSEKGAGDVAHGEGGNGSGRVADKRGVSGPVDRTEAGVVEQVQAIGRRCAEAARES